MLIWMVDPRNYTPYYDYSLCKALGEIGCQVRWFTRPYPYDHIENRDGLAVDYAFGRSFPAPAWLKNSRLEQYLATLAYPLSVLNLLRRIRHEKPDILHVQWTAIPLIDQVLFQASRTMTVRLVYTVHNVLPHEKHLWHGWVYRKLYVSADRLIVHSYAAARWLCQELGLLPVRIAVIPQGNLSDFAEPVPKQQAQHMLGLNNRAVLLFFGIIRPYKGLQYLLLALPRVREVIPNVHLLVVGHVHRNCDLNRYRDLIERLGLWDMVSLYTAFMPHKQLGLYFGAADVVVLPYLETTDSAVIPTAYTFGRPVVTTWTGGLPEVVEEGRSGRLVPPGDCVALADALIDMLSDPVRIAEMGAYARHLAETRHAWPAIARATMELYQEVLTAQSGNNLR